MKIVVHVLLKNEENFVWYSIMSVINYVDKILIWDTGSTDNTIKIINEIKSEKIVFKKVKLNKFHEDNIRQQMLDETDSDWFIVLDADEIWWDDSIKIVVDTIRNQGKNLESIVVPTINMVGDMYHFQEKEAGRYNLVGRVGHYNLRAINRKIPGLHGEGEHGVFGWTDGKGIRIENRDENKIKFINAPYLHVTHLKRSSNTLDDKLVYKRSLKLKYELGIQTSLDYYYPEVFFRNKPPITISPWKTSSFKYKLIAAIETPFKKIYRRLNFNSKRYGY